MQRRDPSKPPLSFPIPFPALPNPLSVVATHFGAAVQSLGGHARRAFQAAAASPPTAPSSALVPRPAPLPATPEEVIEERLAGVPVYALSNPAGEFVLVSGARRSGGSLGFFCFKEADAEAMLEQMRVLDRGMREGSKVVAVALNKVVQLKVDGVAFRFIPDACQVENAIKEKEKLGKSIDGFPGVPVFQSRSLFLKSHNKKYRPFFFRKEDLEESLHRASRQQNRLNPAFRKGDIQVDVLEEIINAMKGSSSSKWDDVVFIPPGFDVSVDLSQETSN